MIISTYFLYGKYGKAIEVLKKYISHNYLFKKLPWHASSAKPTASQLNLGVV